MTDFILADAFASTPFTGNPAAVVWLERPWPDDAYLQALASEFNQAETAYVRPRCDGGFDLRWFTPAREVVLCGHATLASAHALREWGRIGDPDRRVRFVTRWSGELTCVFDGDRITMDFPATPPEPAPLPGDAAAVLGVDGPVACVGTAPMNLTLRVPVQSQVAAARPNLPVLATWHRIGVIVTAPGDDAGIDFVSRFFAPAAGIDEDPVTGSAHCALAVYWAAQLGKTKFTARQLSRRGGRLEVELLGDRVALSGTAVTTLRGTIG
jgi:PhzF family phenazine biosynthesis protein